MYGPVVFVVLLLGSTQAQYEYATACMPENFFPNICTLTLMSDHTASVTITTYEGTEFVNLAPLTPYKRDFDSNFHPTTGREAKAIRITSDVELQVLLFKSTTDDFQQDVVMVPNQLHNNDVYYTTAYVSPDGNSHCGSSANQRLKQFYIVATFYDSTYIHVTQQDGTIYDLDLRQFGIFTQTTDSTLEHLALGTRITSDQPINVISGNICVSNSINGMPDTVASSIPTLGNLGTDYVIPPIVNENFPRGYSISVTATRDFTTVNSDYGQVILNEGQTDIYELVDNEHSSFITCSQPCLVAQFSKDYTSQTGLFMQTILSEHMMYTSTYFTTMDTNANSFLSIVTLGDYPGDDLYLNGNSLGYLTWTPIGAYVTAELTIPLGTYTLYSTEDRPFAAYVYTHVKKGSAGSGYSVLPTEANRVTTLTPPPTTPPTTPSTTVTEASTPSQGSTPPPSDYPQHRARVNGTALTSDGQTISPFCRDAHTDNLNDKTQDMIARVNAQIGVTLCAQTPSVRVRQGTAVLTSDADRAQMTIEHYLAPQGGDQVGQLESCANEVASYLSVLNNWDQPLFPDVSGCSTLIMNPAYLPPAGTLWDCSSVRHGSALRALNALSYESKVSDVLSTSDGSSLDGVCTMAYAQEASDKTVFMRGEITKALSAAGCSGTVTSITSTESFIAMGNQAYFVATFYYLPYPEVTFDHFLFCMEQMHDFSLQHDNWSPGIQAGDPFFPVVPGCPALLPVLPSLDDEGLTWLCV